MNRILLFLVLMSVACGNPDRTAKEKADSLRVADSLQKVLSETSTPEGSTPETSTLVTENVQVGSDERVRKSTEDTLYYEVLKFQPIPADFYQLTTLRPRLVDLSDGASKRRLVIQVTTSQRLSPDNEADLLLHNYYSLAEVKDGKPTILSLVTLDDTEIVHRGFGVVDSFYQIDTLAVKENGSAILVRILNDGGGDYPEKGTIYMLNNDKVVPVLEHAFAPGSTESGTQGTSDYFRRSQDSFDVVVLESSTGGFRDVRIQELSYEQVGTQASLRVTRGKDCKWDGEKYACEGVMEVKH